MQSYKTLGVKRSLSGKREVKIEASHHSQLISSVDSRLEELWLDSVDLEL